MIRSALAEAQQEVHASLPENWTTRLRRPTSHTSRNPPWVPTTNGAMPDGEQRSEALHHLGALVVVPAEQVRQPIERERFPGGAQRFEHRALARAVGAERSQSPPGLMRSESNHVSSPAATRSSLRRSAKAVK